MKKFLLIFPALAALGGCQSVGLPSLSTLTPAQKAALLCLATDLGTQLATVNASPTVAAKVQGDGTILCKFGTGASTIVAASTASSEGVAPVK